MNSRRGQVAIFVIVALVIVAGVIIYFIVRGSVGGKEIPQELQPVFDYYLGCIEQEALTGIQLAGAQGGRVYTQDYAPGSEWAPFSSHLNFLGSGVPYWYYIAGNGLIKDNVPSEAEMEMGLGEFIAEGLDYCDFESFYQQGFEIDRSGGDVDVEIGNERVRVIVSSDLSASKGESVGRKTSHVVEVNTKLGKFYDLALEIYERQKQEAFLERYALDVLYLYAPVDGVEMQCGPKVWGTQEVIGDLKDGLEANLGRVKFQGSYYQTTDEDDDYYIVDLGVDESVNVMYAKEWPTKVEIYGEGVDDDIMTAEAVGTQAGLGVMGFCYVPYHFVYDVSFPTMIQLYDNEELFQFPVVVIIDKNVAREAELTETLGAEEEYDLCDFSEKEIAVNIFDSSLRRVDANVSFECFDQRCRLGESRGGAIKGFVPKCVNGYLHLRADGFADKAQLMSTNKESFADVILEREYDVDVSVEVDGEDLKGMAVVAFEREDGVSKSVALHGFSEVALSEGSYDVTVYVYGNSSITIPASSKYECVDAPREGLLGIVGLTEEKCFNLDIPETHLENALVGGGKVTTYILESDLEKGGLVVKAQGLPVPNSLEQMQQNFDLFEAQRPYLVFE